MGSQNGWNGEARAQLDIGALSVRNRFLKPLQLTLDIAAVALPWLFALAVWPADAFDERGALTTGVVVVAITAVTIGLMANRKLYRARVNSVWTMASSRLIKVSLASIGIAAFGAIAAGIVLSGAEIAFASVGMLTSLIVVRSGFQAWLRVRRSEGAYVRPVLVVGTNTEAKSIIELVDAHPDLGIRVAGVVGNPAEAALSGIIDERTVGSLYRGPASSLRRILADEPLSGVIVASTAFDAAALDSLIRDLGSLHGVHVQVSSGITGVDHRRIQAQPLAYEPMFYLDGAEPARWQLVVKRAVDFVAAGLALILTAVVLVPAALAVRFIDGRPVLDRQRRIGLDGREFTLYRLRTMQRDGSQPTSAKARSVWTDPRMTALGRLLEATSVSELPQLWNVLRGDLSLVGPEPVRPVDSNKRPVLTLRPGVTGLWKVEARHCTNPDARRRLDEAYLRNWTGSRDAVLLIASLEPIMSRFIRGASWRNQRQAETVEPIGSPVAVPATN